MLDDFKGGKNYHGLKRKAEDRVGWRKLEPRAGPDDSQNTR